MAIQFDYDKVLRTQFKFNDLSIKDLLAARDLFHVHLMNKRNVVATAIGRYRIRKADPRPGDDSTSRISNGNKGPRTLGNSEVRDYSWPCILVFVKEWVTNNAFRQEAELTEILPRNIYMPDGRVVPICVVQATKDDYIEEYPDPSKIIFPGNLIGGGFPLLVYSQGVQRVASIG